MTPKTLLIVTVAFAVIVSSLMGWRKSFRSFLFWGAMAAAFCEIAASQLGFNRGFSDTLLKHLVIIFGLGGPIYAIARHAGSWARACAKAGQAKTSRTTVRIAVHVAPLLNLALPGLGLVATGVAYAVFPRRLASYKTQVIDSAWFQAIWGTLLFASYVLSAMPIGIFLSAIVISLGISRIAIGLTVICRGYDYAYYLESPINFFKLMRAPTRNSLTKSNKA
ncbi:hypothetical protein IPC1147_30875 [Pseudomonas aeruginosa]|uniref:hypothetical protein n=1 Tax=Pseudomonas aeruginosa TaxID=287 RepID=UPI000FFE5740|nr:hypothetical protein [Pseudomonas aeruginosa]MBD1300846.1 hypothetical protein [Pseudomonas aeruginosa]MBD1341629.1 hypothetical protein [Pseudomonas aeruginosa]MDP5993430.1 hypothetical protein [Pseudomonas aeruginosa]RRS17176.1 hypothetical protein IPC1107_30510 [Pseudomonas aeruginosa]RRS19429.1 hypothetical protein IPC1147_30875 [Pseudomonas aeruginosa]